MSIEIKEFGLTEDMKARLLSVGLTKEEIKMVDQFRIGKELKEAREKLDKLESKTFGDKVPSATEATATAAVPPTSEKEEVKVSKVDELREAMQVAIDYTKSLQEEAQKLCPSCPPAVCHVLAAIMAGSQNDREVSDVATALEDYFSKNKENNNTEIMQNTDFIVPGSEEDLSRIEMMDAFVDEGKDSEADKLEELVGMGPEIVRLVRKVYNGGKEDGNPLPVLGK